LANIFVTIFPVKRSISFSNVIYEVSKVIIPILIIKPSTAILLVIFLAFFISITITARLVSEGSISMLHIIGKTSVVGCIAFMDQQPVSMHFIILKKNISNIQKRRLMGSLWGQNTSDLNKQMTQMTQMTPNDAK
jgi:hypothetical protein